MLKNLYGFEYLIAPYTVAHLKLAQFLHDKGYAMQPGERLNVYLTNTLEPIEPQGNLLLPALSREVEEAQATKDKPILVITGNPPYAGHSKNTGTWITKLIDTYKQVDGKKLGERNPKWLQDDYVKFIRFAQWKMEQVAEGAVGIITNHSFLDNPTFRGMRQSLLQTFNRLYLIDLHGNAKRKETTPEGGKDENVFDIEQGVAVSLLVKQEGLSRGVYHADLWGTRQAKYRALLEAEKDGMEWTELKPSTPFYLFVPQDEELRGEYERGWKVTEIFSVNVLGFQTHRDHFAITYEKSEIEQRVREMRDESISDRRLQEEYKIRDTRDWHISEARAALQAADHSTPGVIPCSYRPFDTRWCFFGYEFMDCPRRELMNHVAWKENVCLLVPRQIGTSVWLHGFVADSPPNDCLVSNRSREANYVFPLYRYPTSERAKEPADTLLEDNPFEHKERIENFSQKFRAFINANYQHPYSPEDILGYIYAVLHSPTYRQKYLDFLKTDFPRIPFVDDRTAFETLSQLGWGLLQAHLLKSIPATLNVDVTGGDFKIEKPRYDPQGERLHINKQQYFRPVPADVWNFHIGGYQVLDKYLKSRKSRTLSLDEIENVQNIVNVLRFTIEQMERIDECWKP